jgi:threonine/homoserine/homoserine lactone efflux protein
MLSLAAHALRATLNGAAAPALPMQSAPSAGLRSSFLRGFGIHLTNPKAVLMWLSVIALGLPPGANPQFGFVIIARGVSPHRLRLPFPHPDSPAIRTPATLTSIGIGE